MLATTDHLGQSTLSRADRYLAIGTVWDTGRTGGIMKVKTQIKAGRGTIIWNP